MAEDFGTPTPVYTPEEPKKKSNTVLIIVIVVLIVLCCCCVFAGGIGWWLWNNGDALLEQMGSISSLGLPA